MTENIKQGTQNIKQGVADKTNEVGENMRAKEANAKYEVHKGQMTDPDQPVGDRMKAGAQAVGDTMEHAGHKVKETYYKNK